MHRFIIVLSTVLFMSFPPKAEAVEDIGITVGTYDSRCLAIAYYNSEAFDEVMRLQEDRYEEVLETGSTEEIAEFEASMEEMQHQAHLQSFSTGSVDNIISVIYLDLPVIAEEMGVDLIVSSWDLAYIGDDVTTVNVTDAMVDLLSPSDEVLEILEQVKMMPAIPPEMLPAHME